MTKKKKTAARKTASSAPVADPKSSSLFSKNSVYAWVIALIAFAAYANSLQNEFTLDDGMVLSDNKLVMKGVSGIPDILTHDSFYGSIGDTKNLSGGRYRPLSLVFYALEVSVFGKTALPHHLINLLLYGLTCVVLLKFLTQFIFPQSKWAAFITALLFAIHPIHTEVVANIKSRDEILSLLFLLLTLHYLLKYLLQSKKTSHYFISLLYYLLALFSKENGLIFIVMIPMSIYFFTKKKTSEIFNASLGFWLVAIFYIIIRFSLLGVRNQVVQGVMDNPYILASGSQKLATILFVGLMYLKLLFFPYPLTYDYSYHQVPYRNFSDPLVIASLVIYAALAFIAFIRFTKKDIFSWCILFFFGTLFLVSNLFFNIGAPLAERFLYQASLPFLIAFTEIFRRVFSFFPLSFSVQRIIAGVFISIITSFSFIEIYYRNQDWKTDQTLFLHDVSISSQSARANTYAGIALVRLCDATKDPAEKRSKAEEAIEYFKKSLKIKDDYLPTLLNIGVAYSRIDSGEAAEKAWTLARTIEPDNSNLPGYDNYLSQYFFREGMRRAGEKKYDAAIADMEKAAKYDPSNYNVWYNLGGAYFTIRDFEKARTCWQKTLQLNPNHQQAKQGLIALPPAVQK